MQINNEEVIGADYFIWAADPWNLFHGILDDKYIDPNLKYMYEHPEGYDANTGYQAAFGIKTAENLNLPVSGYKTAADSQLLLQAVNLQYSNYVKQQNNFVFVILTILKQSLNKAEILFSYDGTNY